LPYQDKSGADLKRSVIGGFKVKRIEDERTGACEITVTITTIKVWNWVFVSPASQLKTKYIYNDFHYLCVGTLTCTVFRTKKSYVQVS
jgi:hypothetical protein